MRKTIFTAAILLFANAAAVLAADQVTRTINVASFDGISCNIPCEIKYETGAPKVILRADGDIIDNIRIAVENGTLSIRMSEKRLRGIKGASIYITSDILNSLSCNGACEFENKNGISTTKDFTLSCNGACDCEIASIRTPEITVTINGVGDCEIEGIDAGTVNATINGAGSLDLGGRCIQANLTINGAGEIDIDDLFAEHVNSAIHGAGSIARK
ncbi:MAG: DUF2807 domain-containing protein [Bacteroidales bacterium]|nr:DUF2807 domain-containing protein [Bacteroidales bacterium]